MLTVGQNTSLIGGSGTGKTMVRYRPAQHKCFWETEGFPQVRECATRDETAQSNHNMDPNILVQASECPAEFANATNEARGKFVFVEVPAFNADGDTGQAIAHTKTWLTDK